MPVALNECAVSDDSGTAFAPCGYLLICPLNECAVSDDSGTRAAVEGLGSLIGLAQRMCRV